jgi:predicted PurR-regulated permease PerM
MLSGDTFRRKLLKLAGDSLTSKKITLQALNEITGQIQRYLQVQLLTSALVGVLTWLALHGPGPGKRGGMGHCRRRAEPRSLCRLARHRGGVGAGGFMQFGSLNMALAVGGASLVIHTLVGNLLTPWLTSRASRMNPVAVFVGLLAWGWLWGVWGLLLGIPILMIVKSICDRVEDLKPIGENSWDLDAH